MPCPSFSQILSGPLLTTNASTSPSPSKSALVAAVATAYGLNRYRLSRFFFYPPMVFLALAIIYTGVIGTFLIPV